LQKSFKTEIAPTSAQMRKINQTIGVCRFVYNLYIAENKKEYKETNRFINGMTFSVWLNNEYIPSHSELEWIKKVSSKSVKKSIMNGEGAFKKFFRKEAGFPNFKKKNKSDVKMYFVKNNKTDCICQRHRIKVPTLGWVKLKEKGFIPTTKDGYVISGGTISKKAGRYYISVLIEVPDIPKTNIQSEGIGIDLGVKDFAVLSDGTVVKNINKTGKVRKIERRLKRAQKRLSRKYESLKKRKKEEKGETTQQNIQKQILKVQKLHHQLDNIRTDYVNKCIWDVVKTKPAYIVIEDLNVSGMMKNRHLSKVVAVQKFYEFRVKLTAKCKEYGIELRIVDRFYPSSKICHQCGTIKKDLKLSDRTYRCTCGYEADRDYNASLNLRDAKTYKLA
jgi:putative transposase